MNKDFLRIVIVAAAIAIVSPFTITKAQAQADRGIDVVDVVSVSATVEKIDVAKRKVSLLMEDGKKKNVKVDKAVKNLDKIQVGDKLKIDFAEEIIILVGKSNGDPAAAAAGMASVAPKGAMPGGVVVSTSVVSAKILSVDAAKSRVVLEEPGGKKKTVKLGKKVGVGQLKAGETVEISITDALAIQVVKQ